MKLSRLPILIAAVLTCLLACLSDDKDLGDCDCDCDTEIDGESDNNQNNDTQNGAGNGAQNASSNGADNGVENGLGNGVENGAGSGVENGVGNGSGNEPENGYEVFYSDPLNGSMSNDGSYHSPWGSLQEIFATRPKFSPGTTVYLKTGPHGEPYMTGYNTDYVTIKAYPGEKPIIASIQMDDASYWAFEDLSFSADGSGGGFSRRYLFAANQSVTHLLIDGCVFYSAEEIDGWSKDDWYEYAVDGVMIRGEAVMFSNNTIRNVYHALEFHGDHSLIIGNHIENFGADAIRSLASNSRIKNNSIQNAYIDDYHTNHDDAIQMWNLDGPIENMIISGNKIISFAKPVTDEMLEAGLVSTQMQGIILTDGRALNIVIENNLVVVDHYHGITLQGADNCRIQNNTVLRTPHSVNPNSDAIPWIQMRQDKQGNESANSIIRNNISTRYTPWTYASNSDNMTVESNIEIDYSDYALYFSDYPGLDFTLRQGSPAIDAGTNADLPDTDILGNPRLVGPKVDCGAYEYQG